MSAHTPGPWRVKKATVRGEVNEWYVTDDGGVAVIASCVTDIAGEPSEANARLIASAPDLLGQHEADITDLDLLEEAMLKDDHQYQLLCRIEDMKRRKKAVIAKATGGAA